MPSFAVRSISAFADVKPSASRELLSLLPWYIDFEVLFTDLPQVWLRADHPALNEEWNLATFLRYPHINICWEQSDTWALDDVLHELGHKRTVALTVPGFEQSLFMAAQPITRCWPPRRVTAITITSSTTCRWCRGRFRWSRYCWKKRGCPLPCYGTNATATTRR
jgi:DNA-binding transcriptional LysR family regulator